MIPVRNLYFILLYAWDLLEQGEAVEIAADEMDHPIDLLAYVLVRTAEPIVKQGLDRCYVPEVQILPTVRGSIDFGATFSSGALARRELVCSSEGLSQDVIHNQILKATLKQLSLQPLSRKVHLDVLSMLGRMGSVSNIRLTGKAFGSVHLHRNNRRYALPLAVCRMLFDQVIVGGLGEVRTFASFFRDEVLMRRIFESFVRNLLKRRLPSHVKVGGKRIPWADSEGHAGDLSLLPTLNMDVVVEEGNRSLIIDTKYTAKSLEKRWTVDRFRSPHMYQIFAYAQNYAAISPDRQVSAMLLYPAVRTEWVSSFRLQGRKFWVATIGLDQDWPEIERRLIDICRPALT